MTHLLLIVLEFPERMRCEDASLLHRVLVTGFVCKGQKNNGQPITSISRVRMGVFINASQAQPCARWSSPASAAALMSPVVLYLGGNELAG